MNIVGKKVILRAVEEDDLPLLHKWANDPELSFTTGIFYFPSSMNFHMEWLEKIEKDLLNKRFAIDTDEFGLIGLASLMNIDWKNRNALHGLMLGDESTRGKGFGTDTIMTIMRYAFEELNLNRLDAFMIEYNQISQHTFCDKCGWKKEGVRRDWFFRNNRYWDKILVGITKADYLENKDIASYWDNSAPDSMVK